MVTSKLAARPAGFMTSGKPTFLI
ncbi:MAG: hypothetical protein ACD_48C00044G0001, partial [uncultured bacterium]